MFSALPPWSHFLRSCGASVAPTLPTMHRALGASGPAQFLERIGTWSQDSLNEGCFTEKVRCFFTVLLGFRVRVCPLCPGRPGSLQPSPLPLPAEEKQRLPFGALRLRSIRHADCSLLHWRRRRSSDRS